MSRRRRFTGHRNQLGHYLPAMQDMPPPQQDGDLTQSADIQPRYSPHSAAPQSDAEYPFGLGGIYQPPLGTPAKK